MDKEIFRGGGLLSIALLYAAFFLWLGNRLWNTTQYQIVGGLLYVVVVCLTPLAVYGFELVTGLWVDSPSTPNVPAFRVFQYQIKVFIVVFVCDNEILFFVNESLFDCETCSFI
jgi:high-affinity Fe2+/Pb2+ permease